MNVLAMCHYEKQLVYPAWPDDRTASSVCIAPCKHADKTDHQHPCSHFLCAQRHPWEWHARMTKMTQQTLELQLSKKEMFPALPHDMKRPVTNFSNLSHSQPGEWVWEWEIMWGFCFSNLNFKPCSSPHSHNKQTEKNEIKTVMLLIHDC